MPLESELAGLTLHTRITVQWDKSTPFAEIADAFRAAISGPSIWQVLSSWEDRASAMLADARLEPENALSQLAARGPWSESESAATLRDRPHTPEWFAAYILRAVRMLRHSLTAEPLGHDIETAIFATIEAVECLFLMQFKATYEADVLNRRSYRRDNLAKGRRGGVENAKKLSDERLQIRARAVELRKRDPHMSVAAMARSLAKVFHTHKPRSIERLIRDLKPVAQ